MRGPGLAPLSYFLLGLSAFFLLKKPFNCFARFVSNICTLSSSKNRGLRRSDTLRNRTLRKAKSQKYGQHLLNSHVIHQCVFALS